MNVSAEIERVLIDEGEIAERIGEIAAQIDADYQGKTPIMICILKGSLIFCADLILLRCKYDQQRETVGVVGYYVQYRGQRRFDRRGYYRFWAYHACVDGNVKGQTPRKSSHRDFVG